ncbi:MAG: hypothetical protein Sapg2KO_13580 [Saprospiraceae bacterium]
MQRIGSTLREIKIILSLILLIGLTWSCEEDTPQVDPISLFGITINGINLVDGTINVPVDAEIELLFSAALDIPAFESAFTLKTNGNEVPVNFRYSNASSKAIVSTNGLDFNTTHTLTVSRSVIGARQESLEEAILLDFTTLDQGEITQLSPCTTASDACVQTLNIGPQANFDFFSNYPIFLENVKWELLENAVIVVHGQNRNADEYFSFLTATYNTTALSESTVLIAPFFKDQAAASPGEIYWRTTSAWREGERSDDVSGTSSFEVIDAIIAQLANKDRFPVLKKVIITGHSSGGLWTHLYAASNRAENEHSELAFEYVVANSQYFYYPDEVRYDENSQSFVAPTGCGSFALWPFGYSNVPSYLDGVMETTFNQQLVERKVTYLLGNGTGSDPSLNTRDCEATLLGSSRFRRGENAHLWITTNYSNTHQHQKVTVEGIGHNGQQMYQSPEFRTLIQELLK